MSEQALDVAALKALAEKATPGPWTWAYAPRDDDPRNKRTFHDALLTDNDEQPLWLVWTRDGSEDVDHVIPAVTGDGPTSRANAEFIAAARSAVPALIAALEEAQRQRDQARDAAALAVGIAEEAKSDALKWPLNERTFFLHALSDIQRVLSPDTEGEDK